MRDYANRSERRPPGRDIEITDIETAVVAGNFEWNLVKVHTDAGIIGIGEAYRGGTVTDIMTYLKRVLVGENPLDPERLFRRMIQETSGHGGTTGKVVTAASGIEMACWDILGKVLDAPVYQLLGGKYRDRVRVYCDCHAGEAFDVVNGYVAHHGEDVYRPEAYADVATRVADMGFTALKFDLDMPADTRPDPVNGRLTNAAIDRKVAIVGAVRDAVDDDVELAFDCHWDYTVESAKRVARALEGYGLLWLEDLIPPENMAAQRAVARSTSVPIATGENRFRVHEFSELIYEFGVDMLTPDPTTCGGLAETKAIANRAEENYIPVSPHNVCSPVGTVGCVHLGAAIPNLVVLEYHALDVDWWDELLVRSAPLIHDGYITVPEGPGLGIELDDAAVDAHLVDGETGFR